MKRRKFKHQSWRSETRMFALPVLLFIAAIGAGVAMLLYARGGDASQFRLRWLEAQATPAQETRPRRATTSSTAGGKTINVRAGDDLQRAFDEAQPGDTIRLQAGATFKGTFTLPNKTGDAFITIRSAASDAELPAPDERINPARYARALPKIVSNENGQPAIKTEAGAHNFRFIAVEFGATPDGAGNIIALGAGTETNLEDTPHHIEFDRVFIHGDPEKGQRRGIALNGREIVVINSYISDIKRKGEESQALAGWNGAGPFKIINNYIEAAAENIMFGGADPTIENLVPADIEISRNYLTKPLAWRGRWTVKNVFELKNAQRVRVDGNIFENNWVDGQGGTAILFTVRNQDGNAPWSIVRDVEFTNNIVRHAGNAIAILGEDYTHPSRQMINVKIANNLFYDIDGEKWGGHGIALALTGGAAQNISLVHNTMIARGNAVVAEENATIKKLTINDNIFFGHILKSGSGGTEALQKIDPARTWQAQGNCIVLTEKRERWEAEYPARNLFFDDWSQIGFANIAANQFDLSAKSRCRGRATDKTDIGVNFDALRRAGALDSAERTTAAAAEQ
jgi:hypothetical protein